MEKLLGRSSATGLIQEKIKRLAGGIDDSVQIYPRTSNFDIGLIHPPGIASLLQHMGAIVCQVQANTAGLIGRWWCDPGTIPVRRSFPPNLCS